MALYSPPEDWTLTVQRSVERVESAARMLDELLDSGRKLKAIRDCHSVETCGGAQAECSICGILDCVFSDPLHYHHDGCPSEEF